MKTAGSLLAGDPNSDTAALSELIGSIGDRSFGERVLRFAHELCGASHSSVFRIRSDSVAAVTSMTPASIDGSHTAEEIAGRYLEGKAWLQDPALKEARERLGGNQILLLRTDLERNWNSSICDTIYGRDSIADRLAIYSKSDDDIVGIGLLRTAGTGPFSPAEIDRVSRFLEPLLAASKKHLNITRAGLDVSRALTSLEEISACIEHSPVHFPRREAQVCARIICGIGTAGIGAELGVSEETILTYRKRIYSRLEIATQRELLLWYLRTWSFWGQRFLEPERVH